MALRFASSDEWLEADGLGGFASGTVDGIRTRRYHALLLAAVTPPDRRFLLVNGWETWVETPAGRFALSSQRYAPDVVHPDGASRIESFEPAPWPTWTFRLEDGTRLRHELFARHGSAVVAASWRLLDRAAPARLVVRPLLSGRNPHQLHHENDSFRFDAENENGRVTWRPYPDVPAITVLANASYRHAPEWYRNFLYREEQARGLDDREDLASPGVFEWDLGEDEAVCLLATDDEVSRRTLTGSAIAVLAHLRAAERRRRRFGSRLEAAADAYLVRRGVGKTILAGYPWFVDWGRDTFIALRGLCLASGRLRDAREILLEWSGAISDGMLPNRFVEGSSTPEYDSVDASLWFVIAAHEFLDAAAIAKRTVTRADRARLLGAIDHILYGYERGTRYGIRVDEDGLLAAGEPGVALTWMDAKLGDRPVTPRTGKPVEVQALWLNALRIGGERSERWRALHTRALATFAQRFWNEERGCLFDVVDVDHRPGATDDRMRPNQIFAVGGLPFATIEGERARSIVERVESMLVTPLGLRTLAPGEPGYVAHYRGGVAERDGAYHQGTAWPWLLGAFVEAWVRVRGGTDEAKREARERFLGPVLAHLDHDGLGHVSEVTDAEAPWMPGGCPFQAWSVGEALRMDRVVLGMSDTVEAVRFVAKRAAEQMAALDRR
jgi:predicted glycogen debranching enzyme